MQDLLMQVPHTLCWDIKLTVGFYLETKQTVTFDKAERKYIVNLKKSISSFSEIHLNVSESFDQIKGCTVCA